MAQVKKLPANSVFTWKGQDKKGNKLSGKVEAKSAADVKAQLKKQGIAAKSVSKEINLAFLGPKITPMDVAIFARQLATMMKAGVPLIQSFDIVSDGLDNAAMADLVRKIRNDVTWPRPCVPTPNTLTSFSVTWWIPASSRDRWRPCSTGWRPTRRSPRR